LASNLFDRLTRLIEWSRREVAVFVLLAAAFAVRQLLAGWNSYWLDELYSVSIYGIWNGSAMEAVNTLAATSVHPPLYQFTLYNWMTWFGDSEAATRALSNLLVTGAALFLYLMLSPVFGRTVALLSTLGFSFLNSIVLFRLETRAYGLTLFLSTLSSHLVMRFGKNGLRSGWTRCLVSGNSLLLVIVNTGLLLTHYYNAFFIAAQALAGLLFVLLTFSPRRWLIATSSLVLLFSIPVALFSATWGQTFLQHFAERADVYTIDGLSSLKTPASILMDAVRANFASPLVVAMSGGVLVALAVVRALRRRVRERGRFSHHARDWSVVYLTMWLLLPPTIAYITFAAVGVARFSDRYFLYSTVPLVPLGVIVFYNGSRWLVRTFRLWRAKRWVTATLVLMLLLQVIPGTIQAATARKDDFRGTARQIIAVVESQPDDSFVVLEPAFRETPVINYYLERFGGSVRAKGTIRRSQERAGGPFSFERDPSLLHGADFLILPFVHQRTFHFPRALGRLAEDFDLHLSIIDETGAGLMIFRLDQS